MTWLLLALVGCSGDSDTGQAAEALTLDAGPDVAVQLGRTVTLQASGEGAMAYTWTLGDGTVLEGQQVEHRYDEPGNYGVVVQASAASGETRTDSLVVTAFPAPAAVRPKTSTTLVVDEVRGFAWSVIDETDALMRVDLDSGEVEQALSCDSPRTVSLDSGVVWVACEGEDAVYAVDMQSLGLSARYELEPGCRPYGVVARDNEAWVSCQGTGRLVRLRRGASPPISVFDVGPDPRAVALLPNGQVWASRFRGDVTGRIYRQGSSDQTLARSYEQDSDTRSRGVPVLLQSFAVTPDGEHVVVGGQLSNTDRGRWRDGQDLTFETTVRGMTRGVTRTGRTGSVYDRQFDDHGHAGPLAFDALGSRLFVAHPHAGIIQVLDGWTGATRGSLFDAGIGVTSIVVSSDGRRLWSHAAIDREIREFDLTDLVANPYPVRSVRVVLEEPLTEQEHRGQRLFHDALDTRLAKDGYIACASCHPDGRDDGLVWDFTDRGEGLRNTITLEGRSGDGMGPLHWTGNFDEVQDFEHDIRHGNAGTGLVHDADFDAAGGPLGTPLAGLSEDLDALAAYVATFDSFPRSPVDLVAPEPALDLFSQYGCDTCHAGPLYTDSAAGVRHDVGTAGEGTGGRLGEAYSGFDTPTLLGVWATAPYLHDGSAPTLADAIVAHDLGAEPIPPEDVATLVRLLESL